MSLPNDPRALKTALARYQRPSHGRSILEILITAAPLVLLWAAALFAVRENVPVAVVLALIGLSLTLSVRRERHAARQNERSAPMRPPGRDMGVEQAASILGVAPDASEADVQAAYLRLIRRVHPDAGGAGQAFIMRLR